jgi:ABC-type Fe3+/spermidine/putrescine transport system ATPase subunit
MIEIDRVSKRFGALTAVDDVSLEIGAGEFFALLGPSGCGKTTLLRMLAGFETPDDGALRLDGADLVGVKPHRRPVNMMFQSYALFPHMTVLDNVAYGLRMEGVPKREARERAAEVLDSVRLADRGERRPAQLSGGQRQRVALARALVKRPRVLLLDEPLSALDRQIRGDMQIELKRLQHAVGITFVLVTHDQEEALTMADRIAVMHDGRVAQVGTPDELYERPRTRFVAGFLGDANVFDERPDGGALVVRPERLRLAPAEAPEPLPGAARRLAGTLAEVVYLGTARKYVVDLEQGGTAQARVAVADDREPLVPGARVLVGWEERDGVEVAGPAPGGGPAVAPPALAGAAEVAA